MAGRATDPMLPVSSLVERGVGGRAPLPSADVPCFVLCVIEKKERGMSMILLLTFCMRHFDKGLKRVQPPSSSK